jgi:hypothetical protein
MKADDLNLKPQYRMPRVFGALPGPRNVPKDKQNLPDNQTELLIAVTALTDSKLLEELLPPDCTLDGEPLLTVSMSFKSNIGWLAGGAGLFHPAHQLSYCLRFKDTRPAHRQLHSRAVGKPRRPDHDRPRRARLR